MKSSCKAILTVDLLQCHNFTFYKMNNTGKELLKRIWQIANQEDFTSVCLDVFRFQYNHNRIYRSYCSMLKKDAGNVNEVTDIPFLPIQLFKTNEVVTTIFEPEVIFESSGTTEAIPSRHLVKDEEIYKCSFTKTFELFYSRPTNLCILGLLPSYLERGKSSLVYMVNELMKQSGHPGNGFYLYEHAKLSETVKKNIAENIPTLLIGVTYALIDFAMAHPMQLKNVIVMETGGMKGRKKEMLREEVHQILKRQWLLDTVHSEYGMTELLSQAYSTGDGIFSCPPWMIVLARQEDDPFHISSPGKPAVGIANIIDLANIYSCSFIATDDLVKIHPGGSFEILGRSNNADLRGCSLMIQQDLL